MTRCSWQVGRGSSGKDAVINRLSVVIPNYNYGRYVGDAVRSALALDWPDLEVIVVDDGSTDDSVEVLASFGDRIHLIQQENAGPRAACNRGFDASSGDAVIFLDSDDQLAGSLARQVAAVWRPGISKVQVQMQRVDSLGRPVGGVFPRWRQVPTTEQIVTWMTATGAYPTPPGSGNVYARSFLEQLFPLAESSGEATDSYTLAAAPYLGEVVTIAQPLVRYRIHDSNLSGLSGDPSRFTRQIERALRRHQFALAVSGQPVSDVAGVVRVLRRGRHLLQMRVAERRLCDGPPPLPAESRRRLLWDTAAALASPGPESAWERLAIALWCLATMWAPLSVARALVDWRFTTSRVQSTVGLRSLLRSGRTERLSGDPSR